MTKNNSIIILVLIILFTTSCSNQNDTAAGSKKAPGSLLDYAAIKNKFKYENLSAFSVDTIQWDKRKDFYTTLDSISFFQVYQDTTKNKYGGQYAENIDLDFFYSKQKSKRGLIEFTLLNQREGEYCDAILYNIYSPDGKLISSFRVAGSCGDAGYYETAGGKFINDSTYELLSEDNYKTDNVDSTNIITYSKTITIIKQNGAITQSDTVLKTEMK